MMKYTFKCPACGLPGSVESIGDDEAVAKLMAWGAEHMKEVHPDMEGMEGMEAVVREKMTRESM